jgi:hypothetical protein
MNTRTLSPAITVVMVAAVALVVGLAAPATAHQLVHKINGSDIKANTVTGKQIKESTLAAVPEAKTLPKLAWHSLALESGWSMSTSGFQRPPAYAVDAQGIIHFRGAIQGTTEAIGHVAFVLPSGLVPAGLNLDLPALCFDDNICVVQVFQNAVTPLDGNAEPNSASFISLEGLTLAAYGPGAS